jgi:hypothetical protein
MRPFLLGSLIFAAACRVAPSPAHSDTLLAAQGGTQVVFLGTGTPLPDPDRSGPATAVVVDGAAYLFDAGAGVVRRASLGVRKGIAALDAAVNLKTVPHSPPLRPHDGAARPHAFTLRDDGSN